ncbi:MAG TPA: hypothetical protein VFG69_17545, partial [Nannocystaceae bacterium]|nr:hypothetical protein [Nannocystaceae bacterium]
RTGPFPAIPPSERSGATPRPVIVEDVTPINAGTEPTGVFAVVPAEPAASQPIEAPPVAEALDWARRATELEVTEPLARVEAPPLFRSTLADASAVEMRVRRPTAVVMLATATAIVMLFAVVGGILWLAATEWTSAVDGSQRSSVVAPAPTRATGEAAPSEARIPAVRRDDEPTAKPRARGKRRSHDDDLAPLETIETPTKDATPVLVPAAPVASVAGVAEAPPPPSETASAEPQPVAEPQQVAADEPGPPIAEAVTRPPA